MIMTYGKAYKDMPHARDEDLDNLTVLLVAYDYDKQQTYSITLEQFKKIMENNI